MKNRAPHNLRNWLFFILSGLILGLYFFQRDKIKCVEQISYGKIPSFEMIDQHGKSLTLEHLNDRVWVVDFIFTTCLGPCPIMSQKMASLQKNFYNEKQFRMVSVTVNPEYDSPKVLKEYGDRYNANHDKWHFLTGTRESIRTLIVDGFHLGDIEDIIFHSQKFVLIDQDGNIRGYYDSDDSEDMKTLEKDIKRML